MWKKNLKFGKPIASKSHYSIIVYSIEFIKRPSFNKNKKRPTSDMKNNSLRRKDEVIRTY